MQEGCLGLIHAIRRVDPTAPAADDPIEKAQLEREVRRCITRVATRLDNRDTTIMRKRMLAPEPASLKTVARRVSLSAERVTQIEGAIHKAIRAEMAPDCLQAAA